MLAGVVKDAALLATEYVTDGRYPPIAYEFVERAVQAATASLGLPPIYYLVKCRLTDSAVSAAFWCISTHDKCPGIRLTIPAWAFIFNYSLSFRFFTESCWLIEQTCGLQVAGNEIKPDDPNLLGGYSEPSFD